MKSERMCQTVDSHPNRSSPGLDLTLVPTSSRTLALQGVSLHPGNGVVRI